MTVYLAMLQEDILVQTVCLAHTTTECVATVGSFVKLLGCGEENLGTYRGVAILGIDHIAQRIDKTTSPLGEEAANGTKGVEPLLFM